MSHSPSKPPASSPTPLDLASLFLGPKGENADVLETLLLDALRDHVYWRRNFHPEDGFRVQETERLSSQYQLSLSRLRQELVSLLGELKGGVPFFSPRYIGHMCGDLTMASMVGYFAALLYNPNNVAVEASPVTTRMELEVAAALAGMVGYVPEASWGHLTSGGTVANFEAIWVARNVKYLPLAIRWAAQEASLLETQVDLPNGQQEALGKLEIWDLLNLSPRGAMTLARNFQSQASQELQNPARARNLVTRHTLASLGYQEFGSRLRRDFGDDLPSAAVLVPSTAHYSWAKICRALGIGGNQLIKVPVDDRYRMSPQALHETLLEMAARRQPVVALVGVLGSTEESAVDRLDVLDEVRQAVGGELGMGFHFHADAAWGGYAAAVTRDPDGSRIPFETLSAQPDWGGWPDAEVYGGLVGLELSDSVTIDPHKLGFVPYPAGAISFREKAVRELVSVEAPYLFHREDVGLPYIGRFILEGSKPGAAAAAVWMSHRVLPLDSTGYGRLVGATARGAMALHQAMAREDWSPFQVALLPSPDLNIVCFAVGHPQLSSLGAANALAERIHQRFSVNGSDPGRTLDYVVTRTQLRLAEYGEAPVPVVEELGFSREAYLEEGGVTLLRCTIMDPFFAPARGATDHLRGFLVALRRMLAEQLNG